MVTQTTLDISKEILDQIEMDEHCKVCYTDGQPPLIKIMREGKKDIITHKFSMGKPYVEPHSVTAVTNGDKTHYLAPTKRLVLTLAMSWEIQGNVEVIGPNSLKVIHI